MARSSNPTNELSRKKRPLKRRHWFGLVFLIGLILSAMFLPKIATSRWVVLGAIDRFAGITPLKVDLESVEAGWFTPVKVTGIQLLDETGTVLARVGEVQTEKGILGWITGSSNLGTIRVSKMEAVIIAQNGTTNLEQAFAPFLQPVDSVSPTPDATSNPSTAGTIEVVDSKFLMMEANRPEQWVMAIPRMSVTLPSAGQVIGPIELQAAIADASGTVPNSNGTIVADVRQSNDTKAFEVRAQIAGVPVDFWHVLKARMPELPVDELQGRVSATIAGNVIDETAWSFDVSQLAASQISVIAPDLVGETPARLELVAGKAKCTLANAILRLENAEINCDFANAKAVASVPWPLQIPTATDPFIENGEIFASGSIDLPKLVAAASSLIPIREETQLLEGAAQFSVAQQLDLQGKPTTRASLRLSGLKAMASGQPLAWQEPLTMEVSVKESDAKLQFGANAVAEFANFQATGSIEQGQITGDVGLDVLQQRLRQWVDLPITDMAGSAKVNFSWNLEGTDTVVAKGTLSTTPLVIATTTGGELREQAWSGTLDGRIRLVDGAPQRVEQAALLMTSDEEKLSINLLQPLFLVAATDATPAAFNIDLQTNLSTCNKRGNVWLEEPLEVQVAGNLQLAASGLIDLNHIEVLSANWNSQPLSVSTPQMSFAEPRMVGNFKGRVDTNDLTRLVVDGLQVQSSSFSLGAQDSANPDGTSSRLGRAMFRIDLDRLMRNVGSGTSLSAAVMPATAEPSAQISATGMFEGQLAWLVSSESAGINTQINGTNVTVLSKSTEKETVDTLWQEPSVTATVAGSLAVATGAVDIPKVQFQTPWMNYNGNAAYSASETDQTIQLKGQAVYDCAQLSTKLTPYTGSMVSMSGKQDVPIDVTWTSSSDPNASVFAGLQAVTKVGWEQATVAGILLGKADVPISISNGQLTTAAEIPVSGGALRWDMQSDLTADELVIHQKPMTVLDNVEITQEMCERWLKYVAPHVAEATSVDGRLSLSLDQAVFTPTNSLKQTVTGRIVIHNATVGPGPLSNSFIGLAKQIDAIRKKDFTQTVSNTQKVWLNMPEQNIDFQMLDGKVMHRNLSIQIGDAKIATAGSVGVDGVLDMRATMPIPDEWADKSQWLVGLKGQSLQFPVSGTLSSPQLDSRLLADLTKQALQTAAGGMLQQGLNRGLDKLLGGQGNAPPATEGAAPANPLQGLGGQILGGQGINLPGLFPGFGGQAPAGGK